MITIAVVLSLLIPSPHSLVVLVPVLLVLAVPIVRRASAGGGILDGSDMFWRLRLDT